MRAAFSLRCGAAGGCDARGDGGPSRSAAQADTFVCDARWTARTAPLRSARAFFVASQTGLPIVPFGIAYGNAWRAKSWDRVAVPKPLAGARAVVGEPLVVPPKLMTSQLACILSLLQQRMSDATTDARRWVSGLPPAICHPRPPLSKAA